MIVVTQEGAAVFWDYILGLALAQNPFCHLIGTPFTPGHTNTLATFAALELPLANGYAPIQLTNPGANWTFAAVAAGTTATYKTLNWLFTGALTVYGYFLSDDSNHISWWGEQLIPAYTFPAGGGPFQLQLPPYLISCPGVSAC
jgi:hypothetical protein